MRATILATIAVVLMLGLNSAITFGQDASQPVRVSYDFRDGSLGWQAGFAEYILALERSAMLVAEMRQLPPELGSPGTGFYLQSMNRSDDTFMFLKRRLGPTDGIVPWQKYRLTFTIRLASNAPSNCSGIGGPPGEGVTLKAGASSIEPLSIGGRMNVDKGNQAVGGTAASVAGDIANGLSCEGSSAPYVSILRSHQHTVEVSANARGELWLLVGTDSGFEGLTGIYFQRIEVSLEPSGSPAQPRPTLLTEAGTGRALALDSVTLRRDPFPLVNSYNFSSDRRTRVSLFATDAELRDGEDRSVVTATAVDAGGRSYPVQVEYIGELSVATWINQIVIKLPDDLVGGQLLIRISVRGVESNSVVIETR